MKTEKFVWHRPWYNHHAFPSARNPNPGEREAERDRIAELLIGKVCRWKVSYHESGGGSSARPYGPGIVGEINLLYHDELEIILFRDGDPNDRDGRRLHMMEIEYVVSAC